MAIAIVDIDDRAQNGQVVYLEEVRVHKEGQGGNAQGGLGRGRS